MKSGWRHCITWVASVGEDEHPDPGEGPEVACLDAPRRQCAKDNHRPRLPHTPSRCPHGATLLPCATARCYCGATMPHDAPTTPKVASVVNVPPHARSSHSSEGMALASLDQDEVLEDDF